jgi:hypothetical protein
MEVVLLVYKLVMSAVVVLFLPGSVAQVVFAVVVVLVIAVLMLKLQPYVDDSDDTVSTLAQWVLFVEVFAGLLVRVQANQAASGSVDDSLNSKALACVSCCLCLCPTLQHTHAHAHTHSHARDCFLCTSRQHTHTHSIPCIWGWCGGGGGRQGNVVRVVCEHSVQRTFCPGQVPGGGARVERASRGSPGWSCGSVDRVLETVCGGAP